MMLWCKSFVKLNLKTIIVLNLCIIYILLFIFTLQYSITIHILFYSLVLYFTTYCIICDHHTYSIRTLNIIHILIIFSLHFLPNPDDVVLAFDERTHSHLELANRTWLYGRVSEAVAILTLKRTYSRCFIHSSIDEKAGVDDNDGDDDKFASLLDKDDDDENDEVEELLFRCALLLFIFVFVLLRIIFFVFFFDSNDNRPSIGGEEYSVSVENNANIANFGTIGILFLWIRYTAVVNCVILVSLYSNSQK